MNAVEPTKPAYVRVMSLAVALALVAAWAYVLIAWDLLGICAVWIFVTTLRLLKTEVLDKSGQRELSLIATRKTV